LYQSERGGDVPAGPRLRDKEVLTEKYGQIAAPIKTTLAPYRESKSVRYDVYTKNEKASYDVEMRHGKAFEGLLARYFG